MKGIALYDFDFFKRKTNNDLLKESITRILLTSKGERVNSSDFGSNLQKFLFSHEDFEEIEEDIVESIRRWEPRIVVERIHTKRVGPNSINIFLSLLNKETIKEFTYEVVLHL